MNLDMYVYDIASNFLVAILVCHGFSRRLFKISDFWTELSYAYVNGKHHH